jgi:hypothetical protein
MRYRRPLPAIQPGRRVVIIAGALSELAGLVMNQHPDGRLDLLLDELPAGVVVQIQRRYVLRIDDRTKHAPAAE